MLQYLIQKDISLLNFARWIIDINSPLQVKAVMFFSDFGVILVALILVALWLYWVYKKDRYPKIQSLNIFYSIALAFIFYVILNQFLPIRPRPEDFTSIKPLIDHLPDNSFPSGHGIFAWAAVLALFSFLNNKIIPTIVFVILIIMLMCRVISGVHYPGDVTVGFILWLIFATPVTRVQNKIFYNKYFLDLPIKLASYFKL